MIGRWVGLLLGIALVAVGCSGPLAVSARATITLSEQACIHVYVLYSTSCVQCRYVKPIVTRLIAEHLEGIDISLLSTESAEGKDVRRRHGVRALPAVVAVGTNGKAVGSPRYGMLTEVALRAFIGEATQMAGCANTGASIGDNSE